MRLGVSAKVFLAYALLVLAFVSSSVFTLMYMKGARDKVVLHGELQELRLPLDSADRNLSSIDVNRHDPRQLHLTGSSRLITARANLNAAVRLIEESLKKDGSARRRSILRRYSGKIAVIDNLAGEVQSHLGKFVKDRDEGNSDGPFPSKFQELKNQLDILSQDLRKEEVRLADDLRAAEDSGTVMARALVLLGLLVAVGTALVLVRTLRPLGVLRMRARQIASGHYAERVGLSSRDEIGDLAREFDAMAQALDEREARLIRSERLATVGKVAAQIAHEIRNPLASIGLNAELLGDELPVQSDEGRRLVASIAREVDRLNDITETYLRFVRLPKPKAEREDPGALVTAVLDFARAELAAARVELTVEVAPGVPEVSVDENQLRQALLNLVRNAKEAMPGGGRLRVAVSASGDGGVSISVSDTGPGIAAEHRSKIFDPFFSTKDTGTGLGLALVQQIVGEHGGRIEVQSAPGAGTTFKIGLPPLARAASEPPPKPDEPAAPVSTTGLRLQE